MKEGDVWKEMGGGPLVGVFLSAFSFSFPLFFSPVEFLIPCMLGTQWLLLTSSIRNEKRYLILIFMLHRPLFLIWHACKWAPSTSQGIHPWTQPMFWSSECTRLWIIPIWSLTQSESGWETKHSDWRHLSEHIITTTQNAKGSDWSVEYLIGHSRGQQGLRERVDGADSHSRA